jgi:hypothetical protein
MQIGYVCGFATILLISACGDSKSSSDLGERVCGIDRSIWHLDEVSPPNRVIVWRVLALPAELQVNGRALSEASALVQIGRTRGYRPSPYLILSHTGSVDCDRIRNLSERLNRAFDCRANYCFYHQRATR